MKKAILICTLCSFAALGYSQKDTVVITKTDTSFYSDLSNKLEVLDSVKTDNSIITSDMDDNDKDQTKKHGKWHSKWSENQDKKFDPHWAGVEIGINSYLSPSKSFSLPSSERFMTINTNQSLNFNLNVFNLAYPVISDRLGIVTGMGLEWNNYYFTNKNSIQVDSLGNTVEKTYANPNNVGETSLTTMYISVPLLLEFNFPGCTDKRFHISAGIIGSMLVSSHTMVDYNGSTQRNWSNFNLNLLRYAFTVRAGYRDISIFCRYSPEPLFETNRGPELYPVSVGIAWTLL